MIITARNTKTPISIGFTTTETKPFKSALLALLVPITGLIGVTNANADVKTYAATACSSESSLFVWNGRVVNYSGQVLTLRCPVIRDSVESSNGIKSGWVKVVDQHPSKDITCTLNSFETDQSQYRYMSKGMTKGTGAQKLNFGSMSHWGDDTYYYLNCWLPPVYKGKGSEVQAYQVDE